MEIASATCGHATRNFATGNFQEAPLNPNCISPHNICEH